jgi:hypothetical protein
MIDHASLLDAFAASIVVREAIGRQCGYRSREWYRAQADVCDRHARLMAMLNGAPPVLERKYVTRLPDGTFRSLDGATTACAPAEATVDTFYAQVNKLIDLAVKDAQARAVLNHLGPTDGWASHNSSDACRALDHARREMVATLEGLRELAGEACS